MTRILPCLVCALMVAGAAQADPLARFQGPGRADPIRIENVVRRDGPVANVSTVTFDLAWDHSWRASWVEPAERHGGNGAIDLQSWDAAWVFVKFRRAGDDGWSHATLSADAADHIVPNGAYLEMGPSDNGERGLGVFVHRAEEGSGANHWKDVTLAWQNLADGVESTVGVELKLFAVHMVYVPEGTFRVGDGAKSHDPAGRFSAGDTGDPFRIESEDPIVLGGTNKANLGNHDGFGMERAEDFSRHGAQRLPARFPKGYAAFYCMRQEITEGEFVDFLNTQSAKCQAALQVLKDSPTGIKQASPGKEGAAAVYKTDQPHVACNGLLWKDCVSFAAWAGLRPMTELEFEKACRGPMKPVLNEYAWGTAGLAGKDFDKLFKPESHPGYRIRNPGRSEEDAVWEGDEAPDAQRGNAIWYGAIRRVGPGGRHGEAAPDAIKGPVRAGIFAKPDSTRVAAGASYWGILDLSGSLWERVVTVGNPYGRRFTGGHGAGPAAPGSPESWGMGTGVRGGTHTAWIACYPSAPKDSRRLRVSNREKVGRNTPNHRGWNESRAAYWSMGFRGVRTAVIRKWPSEPVTAEAAPAPRAPSLPRHTGTGGEVVRHVANWLDWKADITNVTAQVRNGNTAEITFDIAWQDSWRNVHNYDAVWLFFKVRSDGNQPWQHVRLAADRVLNPPGFGQEGGTQLDLAVPDGEDGFTGLFLYRAGEGEGALAASGVRVVWDISGSPGIAKDLKEVRVRPFGIRMVYVPAGAFFLGSGGLEPGGFYRYSDGSQHIDSYKVTGPGSIATGRRDGQLWARRPTAQLEDGGEIPASFPNGFAAFYCMKHQIAPAQYAAFLNVLPEKEAETRYAGKERWVFPVKRGKRGSQSRVLYSGGQGQVLRADYGPSTEFGADFSSQPAKARAGPGCFGLSWADGAAFAAWAGLRPMSELELEKAVRGPRRPAPDEVGPSYWGIGGFNTWDWNAFKGDPQSERAVTVGNAAGRRFQGTHGLGTLTLPADWPQADAVGSGMRCTHYTPCVGIFDHNWNLQRARLSDRLLAAVADPDRCPSHKWRGVRTAPKAAVD